MKTDWKVGGTNYTPILTSGGADPSGNGWLRLTSTATNLSTYAYYDCQIPTGRSLVVEFDYASWGGTGADGLSFFLFDGATTTFNVGAYGGSLGYAQKTNISGLSGGYLGLGIDEFGNYSNESEGRVGGPGAFPDAIAIRGPGSGSAFTPGNYAYLAGTTTLPTSIDTPNVGTRPSGAGTRHIRINLDSTGASYTVTASIIFGGTTIYSTTPYTITTPAPATLKMGFTGSTGASTNYHEIRNLTLNPSSPEASALKSVTNISGGTVHAGDTLQYTVTLLNETTSPVSGLAFSDPIPANTSYNTAFTPIIPAGSTATYDPAASPANLTVSGISLPGSGQATITFQVRVNSPLPAGVTSLSNQGTLSGASIPTKLSDGDTLTAGAQPTSVAVYAGPNFSTTTKTVALTTGSTITAGSILTYTITIPNTGDQAAPGTLFTDTIPTNVTYVNGSLAASSGTTSTSGGRRVMNWRGDIAAGATVTVTFRVTVNSGVHSGDSISNQGNVNYSSRGTTTLDTNQLTDGDPNYAGFQPTKVLVTATITLTASKTAEAITPPLQPDGILRYTVMISNTSSFPASGVVLDDPIPAYTTYVNGTLSFPAGTTGSVSGGVVHVAGIQVAANSTARVDFSVVVENPLTAGVTQISNQGSVGYDSNADTHNDTNIQTDSDASTPGSQPTLSRITKSFSGRVWNDSNANGIKDSCETYRSGAEVTLNALDTSLTITTITDANGIYTFTGLDANSNFQISFGAPEGYSFSQGYPSGQTGILSSASGFNPIQLLDEGMVATLNFGDLPDVYHTTLAADGARNVIVPAGQIYLGSGYRTGPDGIPSDIPRSPTSMDGIIRGERVAWGANQAASILVTVSGGSGYLVGWFDWTGPDGVGNGSFNDAGEMVNFGAVNLGDNTLNFTTPNSFNLAAGQTLLARFRLYKSAPANPQPSGEVINGEVEDYQWVGDPTAVHIASFSAQMLVTNRVELKWTTATEVDAIGFNLYRQSENGPWISLSGDALIPANAPGAMDGSSYTFYDDTTRPGVRVTYRLDTIDRDQQVSDTMTFSLINFFEYIPVVSQKETGR